MKNFTSNKSLKIVRSFLIGILFAMCFAGLLNSEPTPVQAMAFVLSLLGGYALAFGYKKSERRSMSFMACGLMTASITGDCDPLTGGVNATFYIANKDDVASITVDPTNKMLATAIVMQSTKKFFTITGQLQSTEPNCKMVKGKYVNQFDHEVKFLVFKIDAGTKKQILEMKDGNFVIIMRNNHTGTSGETKYEIYGGSAGLKAEIIDRDPNNAENLGAFQITLKTQEYAREGKMPLTLFDTDAATTEAHILTIVL